MPRCKISPKISCTDVAKKGELPPLKDKLKSWCCESSTATPCNTTLFSTEIKLWLKEDAWPQAQMWEIKNITPPRDHSMKDKGILSRNALCWTTLHTQLNSWRMLNILSRTNWIIHKLTPKVYYLSPYKVCEPPHLGSHLLGFPTPCEHFPSKTVL